MSVYVGIDVHRKRSQVAVVDATGRAVANRNVANGVETILGVIGGLPVGTSVAFESAFGWGWLVELLEGHGFDPHLVHPSRCKAIASARLKNDRVDAHILAQLLRADLLPEAWIAPPGVRQLRALLRHRIGLVRLRTLLRNRIHAVLADHGYDRPAGCWSGPGRQWLAGVELPAASREVVQDCLALIDALQVPIDRLEGEVHAHAKADPRVKVLTTLPGVGPLTALVILAEIGDITRFDSAQTGIVGRADSNRAWLGPHRPAWTHLQAGLGLAALDPVRSRPDGQAVGGVRRDLPGDHPPSREEDRHHGGRPEAAHPRLPPAHRRPERRHTQRDHDTIDNRRGPAPAGSAHRPGGPSHPGELAFSHEPAQPRSMT
jgi:transposase